MAEVAPAIGLPSAYHWCARVASGDHGAVVAVRVEPTLSSPVSSGRGVVVKPPGATGPVRRSDARVREV
ncbi:hypothetical protein ASF05_07125 [Aeromicrobium sp. Leaf245]|nr:hypothetical protein ASF05_07125 [Aeromicrobium sp. Leaf245]